MNAVEREPVETRVFNPIASEASYKLKQRSYRKTKLKKIRGDFIRELMDAQSRAPLKLLGSPQHYCIEGNARTIFRAIFSVVIREGFLIRYGKSFFLIA